MTNKNIDSTKFYYKILLHTEAVRNFIGAVIKELINRQEGHDRSKLASPEIEIFEKYVKKARRPTYGSKEYYQVCKEMKPALDAHYFVNRHHPEFFSNGISQMNLIDLLEMLCDWKASAMRHTDGNIYTSLDINQKRFGYTDELKSILKNTIEWFDTQQVYHKAKES